MSVLKCSKSGCNSVMCTTYIPNIGYVCKECQELFKQAMIEACNGFIKDYNIGLSLEAWLEKDKNLDNADIYNNIDSYFREHDQDR